MDLPRYSAPDFTTDPAGGLGAGTLGVGEGARGIAGGGTALHDRATYQRQSASPGGPRTVRLSPCGCPLGGERALRCWWGRP